MRILNIIGRIHDTSFGGYPYRIDATIELPAAKFKALKGDLGSLVLEVNNALYKINSNIPAHSPSVDSDKRAARGVKTVKFSYFMRDHDRAEALGFEVLRLRSGECVPKYGQYITIELPKSNLIEIDFKNRRIA